MPNKNKLASILFFLVATVSMAQGPPPPTPPPPPGLPIDSGVTVLLVLAILYGAYIAYRLSRRKA